MVEAREGTAAGRYSAAVRVAVGLTVAFFPFAANADFILDHFYRRGALLNDSGYLAHMMWRGGPGLRVGHAVLGNESFFAFHMTPLFTLTSALGSLLPLSMAQLFALYVGLCHAALSIGVFWLLTGPYRMRRPVLLAIAALLALGFGFNGEALAMIKFPHFEMLIPASLILFLIAWSQNRVRLACVFFLICLTTREDAGFQIFAILAVLTALDRWKKWDGEREQGTLAFLVCGFVYSVAVILVQRWTFSVTPLVTANYLGSPPLAHLDGPLLLVRFFGYFVYRAYIMLPALVTIGWAVATRNPYILVGYVAFVPWTLLQLISVNDAIGTIPYHYGYPYVVASFWPLIGLLLARRRRGGPFQLREPIVGFAIVIAASLVGVSLQANPAGAELLPAFTSLPSLAEERAVDHAIGVLHAAHDELGRVAAEDGVVALATDDYTENETFWPPPPTADTVLYFPLGYRADAARALAASAGLDHLYAVAGTPMLVRTHRTLVEMPTLAPLLTPVEREPR